MTDFKQLIAKAADGTPLTQKEAELAFGVIMSGEATPAQIGGFLMALASRHKPAAPSRESGKARNPQKRPVTTIERKPGSSRIQSYGLIHFGNPSATRLPVPNTMDTIAVISSGVRTSRGMLRSNGRP